MLCPSKNENVLCLFQICESFRSKNKNAFTSSFFEIYKFHSSEIKKISLFLKDTLLTYYYWMEHMILGCDVVHSQPSFVVKWLPRLLWQQGSLSQVPENWVTVVIAVVGFFHLSLTCSYAQTKSCKCWQ